MNQNIKKMVKCTALIICILICALVFGTFALADNPTGSLSDSTISVSYSASGSLGSIVSVGPASCQLSGTTLSASAKGGKGAFLKASQTNTITIKNNRSSATILSFDYAFTNAQSGSKINGTTYTGSASGHCDIQLSANSSFTVIVVSPEGATTASVTLTNISMVNNVTTTLTFLPADEGGSYTVGGSAITASTNVTQQSSVGVNVAATPTNSNWKFMGWYDVTNSVYFSDVASTNLKLETSITIKPVFVSKTTPVFSVNGNLFTDLNLANTYATSHGNLIILVSDGTLASGSYTITNGNTLLIPFNSGYTVYTTVPEMVYGSHTTPSAYKTLTMAKGASITFNSGSKLCVPSKVSASGANSESWNGTPTGAHGKIVMNAGSSITMKSNSGLYVYGYIAGTGTITAESGAVVYEAFQTRSWRGGSASTDSALESNKVFPIMQYYVQNIEATLVLKNESTEYVYAAVNVNSNSCGESAVFIGPTGMFRPSGTITKRYEANTDRLIIDADGDVSMSAITLKPFYYVVGQKITVTINSSDYILPITNNITVNILSGTTTVSEDIALLPGAKISVASGATVKINSGVNVYVYDRDEWVGKSYACAGLDMVVVGYSAANGTTEKRTTADLIDAEFDINGTLNVVGSLYTTEGGANIKSSDKTGVVTFDAAAGTASNTKQVTQSGSNLTVCNVPITAAKLKNGVSDPAYTATAGAVSGDTFTYCAEHNKWEKNRTSYTITYDANGGTGTMAAQSVCSGAASVTLSTNTFTRDGYTFLGWSESSTATTATYTDEQSITVDGSKTIYAVWQGSHTHTYGTAEWTWDGFASATATMRRSCSSSVATPT